LRHPLLANMSGFLLGEYHHLSPVLDTYFLVCAT
jgi:hypothetical protein